MERNSDDRNILENIQTWVNGQVLKFRKYLSPIPSTFLQFQKYLSPTPSTFLQFQST